MINILIRIHNEPLERRLVFWLPVPQWLKPTYDYQMQRAALKLPCHWRHGAVFSDTYNHAEGGTQGQSLVLIFLNTMDSWKSASNICVSLSLLLKEGNIFLVDYAIMDGIPANVIRDRIQHIASPLCLLYEHPEKGLIPIAIQVKLTDSHLLYHNNLG